MLFRHLAVGAAAVAALVSSSSATAASTASATLSQFGYTLFDLNPSDGIAPNVIFSLNSFSQYGSYTQASASDPSFGSQTQNTWSLLPLGPSATSAANGLGSAQSSVSGTASNRNMVYGASGVALGSTQPLTASNTTQFSASASTSDFSGVRFSLSPYTLIVFNGTANLRAITSLGAVAFNTFQARSENASADVSLRVSGAADVVGSSSQSASDSRSLYASSDYVFNPVTGVYTYAGQNRSLVDSPMSVSFSNFTASALDGNLYLNVSVRGDSPLSPVPEAGTAWLMLAGLAGTGWVLRRRH